MDIVVASSRAFHLAHLSRELASLGHNVTLIGYVPAWRMFSYSHAPAIYRSEFLNLLPRSAVALQRPFPGIQRRATLRIMAEFDELVAGSLPKCDVFIGLSGVIVEAFRCARKNFGAITICERGSAHVNVQSRLVSKNTHAGSLNPEYVQRELEGYNNADFVSVPSNFAYNSFIEEGFSGKRLFKNMYGVNFSRFRPRPRPRVATKRKPFKLLFVGGWSYQKGCDMLAEALSMDGDWTLTHVGLRADLPFPDSDKFATLGHVPNHQLSKVYADHDALILPSRQDGFGMVLLEALASGLPLIASPFTGASDIREHLKTKNRVRTIADLSSAGIQREVRKLMYDLEKGKLAVSDASELDVFTWQAYGERYSDFLRQLR